MTIFNFSAKSSSKVKTKDSRNFKASTSTANTGNKKDINTYLKQTKMMAKIKEEAKMEEKLRAERIMKHLKEVKERNRIEKERQEKVNSKSKQSSKLLEKESKRKKNIKNEPSSHRLNTHHSNMRPNDYDKNDIFERKAVTGKELKERILSKNKQKTSSNDKITSARNRNELLSRKGEVKSSSTKTASKLMPSSSGYENKKSSNVKEINRDSFKERPIMSRYAEQDRYEERVRSKRPLPSNRVLPPIGLTYKRSMNDRYMYSDNEEEEEEDEEMNDFIDDGDDLESQKEDVSKFIREIFGYDKRKYSHLDDDDDIEEASFAQQMREEVRSAKIGLMEDLEDMRKEEEEKKRKQMKRKRARVIDDDDEDDD